MASWLMWAIGIAVAVLPIILMAAFNAGDQADSRGRRINRRWHT
ncbi:MAG: hypothetical protein ACRD0K_15915 [Egibacteraceae bacterium]